MITTDEAYRRLAEFEKLEEDWDSYGANPPSQSTLTTAKKIIGNMPTNLDFVCPYNGGLLIEYHLNEYHLEISVDDDGELGVMLKIACRAGGNHYKCVDNASWEDIVTMKKVFTG